MQKSSFFSWEICEKACRRFFKLCVEKEAKKEESLDLLQVFCERERTHDLSKDCSGF